MANQYDSDAYRLGYTACERGDEYRNPFTHDTEEEQHNDFNEGWSDAELDLNDA